MQEIRLLDTNKPVQIVETDIPKARRGGVVVKLEATPLLTYSKDYLQGNLPYMMPPLPFSPGTNAVGVIHEVGDDVLGLKVGQRVIVDCNWEKDEGVAEPERVLIGLTGISANSFPMLEDYPNGTWREYGDFPAAVVMPIENSEAIDSVTLANIGKMAVPFGGLRRMNLQAGENVIINGASGYFGSAAVALALAMGANVILTGRSQAKLEKIVAQLNAPKQRVRVVAQTGDVETDVNNLRSAFSTGAHKALCMVGQSTDSHSTQVSLYSLNRGGQLIIMGSTLAELSVDYNQMLLNNWEIKGNFMYKKEDYLALIELVKAGIVDLSCMQVTAFALPQIEEAIEASDKVQGMENVILKL